MVSETVEEYLETIGRLEERGEAATTSRIADQHKVSQPSVSQMLQRLAQEGLVAYRARGTVTLTPQGKVAAGRVVRRHRLWERFLIDVLGLRVDLVHEEACKFEHDTSPEVERLISQAVSGSDTCPHGRPIPAAGAAVGTLEAESSPAPLPLCELPGGETAEIAQLPGGRRAAARFLALGFTVGAQVRMLQNFGVGPIIALVRDTRVAIGRNEARQVGVVRRLENGSPGAH